MAKHVCKIPDPPPDTTRWMGTYGDMVTLLMAFFVMLFAVSETNNQKFVAFVTGLAGPFDNPAIELGLVDGAALQEHTVSPITLIAPRPGNERFTSDPPDTIEEVAASEESQEQLDEIAEQLDQVLAATTVPLSADIRDDERGLVISISTDDVLFPVGSAEMSDVGIQLIGEIAPILVGAPNTVVIEGHTDNTPLNNGGYSNWNLSTDRAVAVLELLGDVHGLPFSRISAAGYGEHRPLMANNTAENRSINRRVEILVVGLDISGDGGAPPPAANGAEDGSGSRDGPGAQDVVTADGQPAASADRPAEPQDGAGPEAGTSPGGPAAGDPSGTGDGEATVAPPPGEDIRPFPDGTQVGASGPSGQTPLATILGQ